MIDTLSITPWSDIPVEFKSSANPYAKVASEWFFEGIEIERFKPKDGVDSNYLYLISEILRSFDISHEHKLACVAYLLSQYFDLVTETIKK